MSDARLAYLQLKEQSIGEAENNSDYQIARYSDSLRFDRRGPVEGAERVLAGPTDIDR